MRYVFTIWMDEASRESATEDLNATAKVRS
jgi:hypothetical protein